MAAVHNSRLQWSAIHAGRLWLLRSWLAFGSLRLYSLRWSGILLRLVAILMWPPLKRIPLCRAALIVELMAMSLRTAYRIADRLRRREPLASAFLVTLRNSL